MKRVLCVQGNTCLLAKTQHLVLGGEKQRMTPESGMGLTVRSLRHQIKEFVSSWFGLVCFFVWGRGMFYFVLFANP